MTATETTAPKESCTTLHGEPCHRFGNATDGIPRSRQTRNSDAIDVRREPPSRAGNIRPRYGSNLRLEGLINEDIC